MKQRVCCLWMVLCLLVTGLSIPVLAQDHSIHVIFEGEAVAFRNALNVKDGHTLAPLRELSEKAGFDVAWENPEIMITNSAGAQLLFTIGQSRVLVNGQEKLCPRAPEIIADVTYVPLRFLCESLGYRVVYDQNTRTATITQDVNSTILTPQLMETKTYFPLALSKRMPMDQNYVVSPWSVKLLLATVANGAQGETQRELLNILHAEDIESLNRAMEKALSSYSAIEDMDVRVTNSYWLNARYSDAATFRFDPQFSSAMSNVFRNSEFLVEKNNIDRQMNAWVSLNTRGNISDLVEDSDFLSAFLNTFSFQAAWETPFDSSKTVQSNFMNRDGETVLVDFMQMECRQNYYEDDTMQLIELPYEDGRISMYLMLPKNGVVGYSLDAAIERMQKENIIVRLPKFQAEFYSDLSSVLRNLVGDAVFTDTADFSRVFVNAPFSMKLGKVAQKSVIWVDETGTEISSATYLQQRDDEVPNDTTVFDAKHPFVFLIRDNVSEEILYIGEYAYAE